MADAPPPVAPVRLIDNLWAVLKGGWSVWVAYFGIVFWGAMAGLWVIWPAFVDWLPLWVYAVGGVLMSVALTVARVLKQPGLSE